MVVGLKNQGGNKGNPWEADIFLISFEVVTTISNKSMDCCGRLTRHGDSVCLEMGSVGFGDAKRGLQTTGDGV